MNWAKRRLERLAAMVARTSIQAMISIAFTVIAVVCMVAMGAILYGQFAANLRHTIIQDNQQLLNQIALNLTVYTRNMMRISDSMYYDVIKKTDLADAGIAELNRNMSLLYEVNSQDLVSIACFKSNGELVAAVPLSTMKTGVDPTGQDWFVRATDVIENQHFSAPHVQNLFADSTAKTHWTISLSRMAELTTGGNTNRGVLLVDMKYSGIEQIFTQMTAETAGYVYLVDKTGEIIYHPSQQQIYAGLFAENNAALAGYGNGIHEEVFEGVQRQVIVKTLSYTGWQLVSVIPNSAFSVSTSQMRVLVVAIVCFAILTIIVVNSLVSSRVAGPIKKLDRSVRHLENGVLTGAIYVGGPREVEHLGRTIQTTVDQLRTLMDAVVREQDLKRKSEFDALQSQINPHFLYNTLDSIVWMIEGGQYPEAISMVTALANLFRISLSRGSNIIALKTEFQHANYYLHIQNIRYKNKFQVRTRLDADVENCATIKLIIQPLLENAIFHAMEYMDGDGVIDITGRGEGDDVVIEVCDNGLGMTAEKVAGLLQAPAENEAPKGRQGSGIGLRNVHQRIRLYYGEPYGLSIESELDEGTTVCIRLPRRPFPEENRGEVSP
ncbi:MAG: sensor histidine kinase [Oscillospiraceae bacterium]